MKERKIQIIGVPIDLGQTKRGVDMGPGALRYAGLSDCLAELDYNVVDYGNIDVPLRESLTDDAIPSAINAVNIKLYNAVVKSIADGFIPLVLGGDHYDIQFLDALIQDLSDHIVVERCGVEREGDEVL